MVPLASIGGGEESRRRGMKVEISSEEHLMEFHGRKDWEYNDQIYGYGGYLRGY